MVFKSIKIKYNKLAQSYFYLSNLSNWHFSCVSQYGDAWLDQLGGLNTEEKKLLNKFKRIHEKYGFDDKHSNRYLGKSFINPPKEASIWRGVKNLVNRDEYLILRKVFAVFESRLDILWKNDEGRLKEAQRVLEREFESAESKKAQEILEKLFGQVVDEMVIHVFAIPLNAVSPAGGANTKEGVVTLELRSDQDVREGFFIVLHELTHYLIKKLKIQFDESLIKNGRILRQIPLFEQQGDSSGWEEAVLICFLPDGYIKNWLSGNNPEKKRKLDIKSREDLEDYLIFQSYHKIGEYLDKNKVIDQEFANFVLDQSMEFIVQSSDKFQQGLRNRGTNLSTKVK